MKHVRQLSRPQEALSGGTQDPIVLKGFLINVLVAVNDLVTRKSSTQS